MAGKNVGITLLGVVVAVGAFVAGNIWAESLHEKMERLTHAIEAWSTTEKAVSDKEIDLNGHASANLPEITAQLKHRIESAYELEDATIELMQAGMGSHREDELSIKHMERLHTIEEHSDSVASADRAVALDSETAALLAQISGLGTLMNQDALQAKRTLRTPRNLYQVRGILVEHSRHPDRRYPATQGEDRVIAKLCAPPLKANEPHKIGRRGRGSGFRSCHR
jgi:hypothetical protein